MNFPALRSAVLLTVFACTLPSVSFAQSPDPLADPESGALLIRPFRPRDYQGSPAVSRILEHPATGELLLLAGTKLHVFDGVQWTAVATDTPAVRCLAVDAAGRVWLGGVDQLGYAERDAAGRWQFHPLADRLPAAHRPLGRVWDCAVVGDTVWFGTETKALRWQGGAFTVFDFHRTGTLLAAGGQVFFQVKNQGLQRWDGAAFQEWSRDPLVAGPSVMRLFAQPDGAIEGMNSAGAFFRLRGRAVEAIAPGARAALGTARIICALPRPDGGWYVGTDSTGLLILDADGRLARHLTRAEGFTDSPVLDLARDRAGALWAATFSGPFEIEQPEAATFFGPAQGLPEGLSQGLARHQGRLYLTASAGLMRLVPGRGAFELTPGSPRYPQKLLEEPAGLLIAHGNGIARLHDDKFTTLYTSDNPCTSLAASRRDPQLLLVGRSAGFTVLRRMADGTLKEVHHWPDLGQIRDVVEDESGAVWLATSTRGIHRLVPGTGEQPWAAATLTTFDTKSRTLPGTSDSTYPLSTPLGVVYNTGSGQARFDAAADRFVPDNRFHQGPRTIVQLGVSGVLGAEGWATAHFGGEDEPALLGRLAPGMGGAAFFPAPPGVQEVLGPTDGGRILIEGEGAGRIVWARSVEGLVRLRPAALAGADSTPWAARLTRFEADGAAQPLAAAAAPVFPYSRNPYVFAWQAPRLERGALVTYRSRLVGWDQQWGPPTADRETRYSALPAGAYRFEVQAADRLGRVSSVAALDFRVTPPPWLSAWAIAGYVVALAAAIFGYVRWRLGRAERERRRLEALVATRTTELAAARDAAEAASRAKSAFLASMSHELRTPLNGVLGYAQLLQADARLAPDQRERLRIVHASGEHLLRMINDVLDLAKIEAGKLTLRPAPFALGDFLRDIAAAHAPAAAVKQLAFTADLAPTLPAWVEGDAQKLRQVLDNLLGNAVKFTAAGSVSLRVAPAGDDRIAFTVTDTGPGIGEEDQRRLFQPFEQAAGRADAPGTGLGLAIARALVERCGGTLTLASTPGRGSAFTATVPLPATAPAAPRAATGRPLSGYEGPIRRVVIVDDHAINRSLLTELLTPLGFACTEFSSAASALAALAADGAAWPDLAIVDLRMPDIDGLELTRRLRAFPRGAALKILLTSASVIAFDPAEATRAGCDDFLPKPFRTADLVEKIGTLLALRWRETASPFPRHTAAAPIPEAARAQLREVLAQGDLDAFRATLAHVRAEHPAADDRWAELDEAAASYQLSRLRALLDSP
ncbi:MAG: response regulator [Verrucomicrobia bacterium]|nr:response regulator [Verrucomicrobiota bacterium]